MVNSSFASNSIAVPVYHLKFDLCCPEILNAQIEGILSILYSCSGIVHCLCISHHNFLELKYDVFQIEIIDSFHHPIQPLSGQIKYTRIANLPHGFYQCY